MRFRTVIFIILLLFIPIYLSVWSSANSSYLGMKLVKLLIISATVAGAVYLKNIYLPGRRLLPRQDYSKLAILAVLSFIIVVPVSAALLVGLSILREGGYAFVEAMGLAYGGCVCWFIGVLAYLCFNPIPSNTIKSRILLVARWLLVALIPAAVAIAIYWLAIPSTRRFSMGLDAALLYLSCLALIVQATFWTMHAGNCYFADSRK